MNASFWSLTQISKDFVNSHHDSQGRRFSEPLQLPNLARASPYTGAAPATAIIETVLTERVRKA